MVMFNRTYHDRSCWGGLWPQQRQHSRVGGAGTRPVNPSLLLAGDRYNYLQDYIFQSTYSNRNWSYLLYGNTILYHGTHASVIYMHVAEFKQRQFKSGTISSGVLLYMANIKHTMYFTYSWVNAKSMFAHSWVQSSIAVDSYVPHNVQCLTRYSSMMRYHKYFTT